MCVNVSGCVSACVFGCVCGWVGVGWVSQVGEWVGGGGRRSSELMSTCQPGGGGRQIMVLQKLECGDDNASVCEGGWVDFNLHFFLGHVACPQ